MSEAGTGPWDCVSSLAVGGTVTAKDQRHRAGAGDDGCYRPSGSAFDVRGQIALTTGRRIPCSIRMLEMHAVVGRASWIPLERGYADQYVRTKPRLETGDAASMANTSLFLAGADRDTGRVRGLPRT